MSEILVIPGYDAQVNNKYPNLVGALESKGHHIIPVTMDWSVDSDPRTWADQIHRQIGRRHVDTAIGHSYGAMTLLRVASDWAQDENPPNPFPSLIFCGLSARYLDDQLAYPYVNINARELNNTRFPRAFMNLEIWPDIANIRMHLPPEEITVFVGGQEEINSPAQRRRALTASQLFECELVVVPEAIHELDQTQLYVEDVVKRVR